MTFEAKVNALDKKDFAMLYCLVYITDYPLNYQQQKNANAMFQIIFNEVREFTPADRTEIYRCVQEGLYRRNNIDEMILKFITNLK